jgi:hypothetical protein
MSDDSNVVPLAGHLVGDGVVFDARELVESELEDLAGDDQVVLVRLTPEGEMSVAATHGSAESHILVHRAMMYLLGSGADQ